MICLMETRGEMSALAPRIASAFRESRGRIGEIERRPARKAGAR
jgi:hypothetical protein